MPSPSFTISVWLDDDAERETVLDLTTHVRTQNPIPCALHESFAFVDGSESEMSSAVLAPRQSFDDSFEFHIFPDEDGGYNLQVQEIVPASKLQSIIVEGREVLRMLASL